MFNKRNIKSIYLRVLRKIRSFFTSGQSKQFFIFLFFFFMASGFWLLRTLYEDYETSGDFRLQIFFNVIQSSLYNGPIVHIAPSFLSVFCYGSIIAQTLGENISCLAMFSAGTHNRRSTPGPGFPSVRREPVPSPSGIPAQAGPRIREQ